MPKSNEEIANEILEYIQLELADLPPDAYSEVIDYLISELDISRDTLEEEE